MCNFENMTQWSKWPKFVSLHYWHALRSALVVKKFKRPNWFCQKWRNCKRPTKLDLSYMNGWYFLSSKHGYQEPVKFFVRFVCQIDYCEWGKWFISNSTRRQWRQWWRRQIRLKVLLQTFCWTWTPIVATKQQTIVEDKLHFNRVWVNFRTNLLKVNSVQETCAKCFAIHLSKY